MAESFKILANDNGNDVSTVNLFCPWWWSGGQCARLLLRRSSLNPAFGYNYVLQKVDGFADISITSIPKAGFWLLK